ncbi:MAG: neutral/alkaline non-lysosomal ceramidase N-terminal domain-containing protein, partial [Caldilineaceae bacterium]|nr:neutral/alkaline non-lysosomal ceramidase N-terminal domain-containing protein [Caldilineaceae bacterium]
MSTTLQPTPTSHLQFGLARADITPPVGIYHPMWGAARHHRATGIHRQLTAEAMAFAPIDGSGPTMLRIQLDHIGMTVPHHQALLAHITAATQIPANQIVTTFSHSHAAGLFAPDRVHLPGGELIEEHVERIYTNVTAAAVVALTNLQPAFITYGVGRCTLATNRDYWDDENGFYACGFNPDGNADDTLVVARITDKEGQLLGVVVNYGCHPTTLAWENTLISPDYVGAMREVVEEGTGATCIFA